MVLIKSNSDMMREEESRLIEAQSEAMSSELSGLAEYITSVWEDAKQSKETVEDIMDECILQRNGIYNDEKLAQIREQGGSEIFMMLTDEKCTALKAWLYDLLLPPNANPFTTSPTPVPDIPQDQLALIEQKARNDMMKDLMQAQQLGMPISEDEIAQRMEALIADIKQKIKEHAEKFDDNIRNKIEDVVTESKWREHFSEVLEDVVDLPAGILKGPIVENGKTLQWKQNVDGSYYPEVTDDIEVKFKRISPYNIFPVGASTDINDGDLFELHRLSIKSLEVLRNTEGFNKDIIDSIMLEAESGMYSDWAKDDDTSNPSLSEEQENDKTTDDWRHEYGKKVQALQFWGAIPGYFLEEHGVDIPKESILSIFDAEIWMIGQYIIRAKLNSHPLGLKPYYKASYRKRNGSFWGEGLPQILRDIQEVCNATARSLVNNMAISSGPQVGCDVSKLAEGENITSVYPWKIWQFDESASTTGGAGGRPPLWFFQPDSNIGALMSVYEFFSKEADNKSGIPRYSYGSGGSASALGTATGMTMMMNNASKGIKHVVKNIDNGIITPSVEAIHTYIMLWDEDEAMKGDIKIKATGSSALVAREQQQVRLNEAMQIAMSPIGLQVLGKEALAVIIKSVFKGLDAEIESAVPTPEEMRSQEMMQQMQMQMMQQQQQQVPSGREVAPGGAVAGGGDVNMYQG